VFDQGQIIEQGSQKQLLKNGSHFAHLWSLQQEGFLPDKQLTNIIGTQHLDI